jgi:hypothetical protein
MVDGINWQIAAYRRNGYTGYIQVLMPGVGTRPADYVTAIGAYLSGPGDASQTMGRAAVWDKVVDDLSDRRGVVLYISSLADGSGGDDQCQPGDRTVGRDDPAIMDWSAARWLSYNADRYQMLKNGENPGRVDMTPGYGQAMLTAAIGQMRSCGLQGLMWAHDFDLNASNSPLSLDEYGRRIAEHFRTGVPAPVQSIP